MVGVTIGSSASPALIAAKASTAGLSTPDVAQAVGGSDNAEARARREAFDQLAQPNSGDVGLVAVGRRGLAEGIGFADMLGGLGDRTKASIRAVSLVLVWRLPANWSSPMSASVLCTFPGETSTPTRVSGAATMG